MSDLREVVPIVNTDKPSTVLMLTKGLRHPLGNARSTRPATRGRRPT